MILRDYRLDPPEAPDPPKCPQCGSTSYTEIYEGIDGIIGCDDCISRMSAEDWWEKLAEDYEDEKYNYEEERWRD